MDEEARLLLIAEGLQKVEPQALSPAQRIFMLVWDLEAEVNNGGFSQYFANSTGRDAPHVSAALKRIGASQCAGIVEQAVGLVPLDDAGWMRDDDRESAVEDLVDNDEDVFEELDAQFFAYPDDLSGLLFAYVRGHPGDFGL